MYKPLVSIVIPAYNASNYLAKAIDSALAQTYSNIEILVINDGSPDDGATREVALSYGDKIRYFEKTNGGSSSALNLGIQEMKGEWFSWLSHDDLYYPTKVEIQISYLGSLAEKGIQVEKQVLFSASDLIDEKGKYIRKANPNAESKKAKQIASITHNCFLVAEGGSKYCFNGCSCFIHREVFERIGTFNEKLRLVNDVDMWKRIFKAWYRVHYLPEALVMGRMHAKQVSASIGFSYHNPEQDAYWNDSLTWLLAVDVSEAERNEAVYLFGCAAYQKTRKAEGKRAFEYLKSKNYNPNKLKLIRYMAAYEGRVMNALKKVYRSIFVKTK